MTFSVVNILDFPKYLESNWVLALRKRGILILKPIKYGSIHFSKGGKTSQQNYNGIYPLENSIMKLGLI